MRTTRLTVFSHLWAIAGFCEWTRWTWTESSGSLGLLLAPLVLIVFPNSVACLALFAAVQMVFSALAANAPWNHGLFMAMMNGAILLAIGRWALRRSSPGSDDAAEAERLVELFAPVLRLGLVLFYLCAFFHKLNRDFLDPGVSCVGVLLELLNGSYRILPPEEWLVVGGIAGTLLVELGVPLLLCFRRTVPAGLALGVGFHLFLSQAGGLHGFAAMLFAVYFLFLPRSFSDRVAERLAALLDRPGRPDLRHFVIPAGAVVLLVAAWVLGHFFGVNYTYRGLIFWDLWLVGVLALFGRDLVRVWREPAEAGLRPSWAPLWAIPALVVLNGLAPYLGLKTETSWSMYSNLRTEVRSNHLVVPQSWQPFDLQRDLVEVLDSSLPALAKYARDDVRLHFFELRRRCSAAEGEFTISYRRGGEVTHARVGAGGGAAPEACRPLPRIASRLLRFRPVDVGPHATCRH